jgi:hypothetical protein
VINDFDSLKSAVSNWLARADLAAVIPDFIQLAEVRINVGGSFDGEYTPGLRVRQMHTVLPGTASNGVIALPADFLDVQQLLVPNGARDLDLTPKPMEGAATIRLGVPRGYAVIGNSLNIIGGAGDTPYSLTYYAKVPAVSAGQNWLILANPSLYLYATLLEAAPYLRADARIPLWAAAYKAALNGMQAADERARFGPGTRMRAVVNAP